MGDHPAKENRDTNELTDLIFDAPLKDVCILVSFVCFFCLSYDLHRYLMVLQFQHGLAVLCLVSKLVSKYDKLNSPILIAKLSQTCYDELTPDAPLKSSVLRWLQKQDDDEDKC